MSKTLILQMVHIFCSNYQQGNKPGAVNFGYVSSSVQFWSQSSLKSEDMVH